MTTSIAISRQSNLTFPVKIPRLCLPSSVTLPSKSLLITWFLAALDGRFFYFFLHFGFPQTLFPTTRWEIPTRKAFCLLSLMTVALWNIKLNSAFKNITLSRRDPLPPPELTGDRIECRHCFHLQGPGKQ